MDSSADFETSERPWGNYVVLHESDTEKVKRITVLPGARLSYQSHKHREEVWVVTEGEATVTLNDADHQLGPGDSIRIGLEEKHRIFNSGSKKLIFIEVQTGSYFGEDDIIRYSDDYNRT